MKAAMRDRYGSPDVVEIRDVDIPTPAGDQVLVRVATASVNWADLDGLGPRWRFLRLFLGLRGPRNKRLGLDVAGVVESVGPSVTRFKQGDRVFGDLYSFGYGAFAEYVCATERAFLPIPADLSFEDAATLPHSAVLAIQGLRRRNGSTIKPGDRVLVVGASGNVGPFLVQIAESMGAKVTGVCRTEKMDFVRALGVDEVIDYTTTDVTRPSERYDWIVDVDAHHGFLRWRRALRRGGTYVGLGGPARWLLSALVVAPVVSLATGRQMGMLLWWKPFKPEDVATITDLVAAGTVKPAIDRRYPLDEVADALAYVDAGRPRGKVIITI